MVSGLLFSSLLALLIIDININHSFQAAAIGKITLFLFITYGILITLICINVFFIIQFFSSKNFNIAFLSPSFLCFSFSFLIFLFLIIFNENIRFYQSFFNTEMDIILKTQSMTLIFMGILGLLILYGYYFYKKTALFFIVYFLLLGSGLTYIAYQRSLYPQPLQPGSVANYESHTIDKKTVIIGMNGLSFDFLIPMINEDKLPNFSFLISQGSWGKLKNFSPNDYLCLGTSFNTGKLPNKHRQLSIWKYRMLPIDYDIEVVPRYLFFRQLENAKLLQMISNQTNLLTKDIWKIFEENKTPFIKKDSPYPQEIDAPPAEAENIFNLYYNELKFESDHICNILKKAIWADTKVEADVTREMSRSDAKLIYFILNGLNYTETYFYKFSYPELFGDLDPEDINKYSSVIERYYQFYDRIIGKYVSSLKEDDLLIVFSFHGIEPLPLLKRILERILNNPEMSAYHDNAPDGVVLFYGTEIASNKNIEDINLIDIAPTLLYYLGLHVGQDMDGVVRTPIFVDSFRGENPVPFISSYDEITIKSPQ